MKKQSIESIVVCGWLGLFLLSVGILAVNIPYYDEWFHTRWALRALDGAAGAGPFEWVNGSRLVLFRSLLLASLRYFAVYSPLPLMAASALCSVFSATLCIGLMRRTLAPSWFRVLACGTVAMLAASLAQHEALLWGLEFSLALPGALAVLGAIAIPHVREPLRLRLALILSLVGLLSFATGMALFVALGFAACRAGISRKHIVLLLALSVVVLVAWHSDFNTASTGANTVASLTLPERLWRIPAHFFAALGSGLTASVLWPLARKGGDMLTPVVDGAAVLAGLVLLGLFAFDLRPRKRTDSENLLTPAAWTLFLFGAASAAFIALGRHDQGVSQALSSRYVTLTVLAPVGAALLLARDGRRLALTLLALAAFGNAGAGTVVAYAWREARVEGRSSLPFVREFPELPGFEALTPDFPYATATELMKRRMISPELAPSGIRQVIELTTPAEAHPPCAMTTPGALTPTYQKPTPALAGLSINASRRGAMVIVGRTANGIIGLSAQTIDAPGSHPVRTTLKGVPNRPVDIEAWLITDASTDFLVRAGACRITLH